MKLRHRADVRTLLWVLAMPLVAGVQYARPELVWFLSPLSCYLALAAGVFAHNHNHCPTFTNKRMNAIFATILSLFYGYPTFAWVPTHNLNHHKFVNRAGDATITWRYTDKHNWLVASTYFFVSSYWQSEPIKDYIRKARTQNRKLYRSILLQYGVWGLNAVSLLALAIVLHGIGTGLFVWLGATFVPAFFALWAIMLFNYIQHVHADPWSKHSHSRNFTGAVTNFFLFNNGFHGAHHENPGAHWSALPKIHAKIEAEIHPDLKQKNLLTFFWRSYVLALFDPKYGTRQVGRAPFDPPDGVQVDVRTAEVPAMEAGTNAAMV
ncbi:MAG TPA: fatty acid desaturase [Polyangiaceae bacterium]